MNDWLKILRARCRALFRRENAELDLEREIQFHIDMLTQEKIDEGLDPESARAAAAREFGRADLVKEQCRESWGARLFLNVCRDMRVGARELRKSPGFAVSALAILGIGAAATLAILSYVNAYLLKPLPYPDSARLTMVAPVNNAFGEMSVAYSNFLDWQKRNEAFESIEAFRYQGYNLTGVAIPERVDGFQASLGLLPMLGARPLHGRLFLDTDCQRNSAPTALLTHRFWREYFEGDVGVVGNTLLLDGEPHLVIGVLDAGFEFPALQTETVEVWTPLALQEREASFMNRFYHQGTSAIGKLKPGATLDQAAADMRRVAAQMNEEYAGSINDDSIVVSNLSERINRDRRPSLIALACAAGCLLLIVCVNIAGLLAARAATRNPELAFRVAVGATRGDLIRQLLSENALLALLGALAGVPMAYAATRILFKAMGEQANLREPPVVLLDGTMATFFLGIVGLTCAVLGIFPVLQSSRKAISWGSGGATRSASQSNRHQTARKILVAAEIAIALVILSGTGLLVRSYVKYLNSDPGYKPQGAISFRVSLPEREYDSDEKRASFCAAFLEAARNVRGIEYIGLGHRLLGGSQRPYVIEGGELSEEGAPFAEWNVVTPDFNRAMGTRLLEGRFLDDRDIKSSAPVALVDERFAQKNWPGESALGKRFQLSSAPDPAGAWHEVVGVVAHIKHNGIDQESRESVFLSASQNSFTELNVVARASGDPLTLLEPLRAIIAELDPNLTVARISSLQAILNEQGFARRMVAHLLSVFAAIALLLAATGIYAVTAYSVNSQRREFGVRLALGARGSALVGQVVAGGAKLAAVGTALGLAASAYLSVYARSLVYGVSIWDPAAFGLSVLALGSCVLLACYLPARRAANTDPAKELRAN